MKDEEDGKHLIEKLPKSLNLKVIHDMNFKILHNSVVFKSNFTKLFLDYLSLKVKSMTLGPEVDIFR